MQLDTAAARNSRCPAQARRANADRIESHGSTGLALQRALFGIVTEIVIVQ
jgi:hypothetical protein